MRDLRVVILLWIGICLPGVSTAQSTEAEETPPASTGENKKSEKLQASLDELMEMLKKQQAQLDTQKQQIAEQAAIISTLQAGQGNEAQIRDQKIESQDDTIKSQAENIEAQRKAMQSLQQQIDQLADSKSQQLTDEEKQLRSRLQTLEDSITASEEADSSRYDTESFPGSIPISGTSAALRIGGFVKMNIVESFDAIGSKDRFIVGTIPVPQESGQAQAALTVSQSRLNFDLREQTQYGPLRAFIEGDFAGVGDTFRLRHAYGQYGDFLIGKTWTTFMDSDASPEELDFEGINGRINVRQPQIRYTPKIGKELDLILSFEDPDPQITGGQSISQVPDTVVSIRRTVLKRWHIKSSALLRQIKGKCNVNICVNENSDEVTGWGLSVSGRTALPRLNEQDSLMFQVSYGKGYGRYVNDLGTLGGMDAVFDPVTGELTALPVFSAYVAMQHWWAADMRSNANFSYVNINNTDFQEPDVYQQTRRASVNFIWSPSPRVDLGGELLWGKRTNNDNQSATAKQLQLSAKYRY